LALSQILPQKEAHIKETYTQDAIKILKATEAKYCNWDPSADGLVQMGTAQYHEKIEERHVSLIYGDYFFIEAILRLCGMDLQIW
jgi:unsaturated chondroitin disaccharide hydrolase